MKSFNDLEEILYSHSTNKIIPGLERIKKLLSRLGNPQNSFKSIHIVGTNGKGSTGAFISSVFQNSGYKTGFYSSPHLESPGERLLINGKELTPDEWIDAANEVIKFIFPNEDPPSYFELLTACAFYLAREQNIEVGIIEAGLGGKLDATNTMDNTICSVIASISIDHTEYLGNTLESIAGEKFDIVKKNIPACFSGLDKTLIPMFKNICGEKKAIPFVLSECAKIENIKISPDGNKFDFETENLKLKNVITNLIGNYQVKNSALALLALSCVKDEFSKITDEKIYSGIKNASWPGRLEIISREPLIIFDGGHNFDGVKNLCESVKSLWPEKKIGIVYAAMRDKNFVGCLELLNQNLEPSLYVTTVPEMMRALTPNELLESAKKFSWRNSPEGFNNPVEAIKKSVNDKNDLTIMCGSLYLIGYVKKLICETL